jgi:MFS superfamily sulfate permease-like transporter
VRQLVAASPTPVRWFLVDAQAITDIDITAAEALHALNQGLQQQGIALKFAHANRPLRLVLERIGFTTEIGRESIFHSVHQAADAFQAASSAKPA